MAFVVSTGAAVSGAVDQAVHTVLVTLFGSFSGNPGFATRSGFDWGISSFTDSGPVTSAGDFGQLQNGDVHDFAYNYTLGQILPGFQTQAPLIADENYVFRAHVNRYDPDFFDSKFGSPLVFLSYAVTATASVPINTPPTSSSTTISCDFFPNTLRSTASAVMQYRPFGTTDWLNAPGGNSDVSGYTLANISRNLTGLTGSTIYEFRLQVTRTTANETVLTSSITVFTTLADAPIVTTVAASSVSHSSATLNGSVDPNGISVRVRFGWGDNDGGSTPGSWDNLTAYQSFSGDGDQSFLQGISGLTFSTPYFFRAFVEWSSPGFANGDSSTTLFFSTSGDPLAAAAEAEMLPIQDFDRKYGVATTVYFVVPSPSVTSSNLFYTGAAVWAGAGECKISKDGAAFADTTNDPAQVGTQLYSLALTAAEMQCSQAFIILTELGATAARDVLIRVRTEWQLGNVDIDALSGTKTNTSAFKLTGHGSGHGLECIGGATGNDIDGIIAQHFARVSVLPSQAAVAGNAVKLDASASATNDLYNGLAALVVSGTGVGQCSIIIDYDGTTKVATLDSTWVTPPAAGAQVLLAPASRAFALSPLVELAAIPTATSSYGAMIQLIFQRFAYKITQTATVQTLFKADSSTSLGTRSVSDDGTTQTITKIT